MQTLPHRLWDRLHKANNPEQISDTINASQQFKKLIETKAWKRIEKWIGKQETGMGQFMEHETQVAGLWSIIKVFNTFVQYLMVLHEHRAYTKIKTFLAMTIKRGDEYAEQREKFKKQKQGKTA